MRKRGRFRSTDGGQTFAKGFVQGRKHRRRRSRVRSVEFSKLSTPFLWAARVAPWEIRSGESFIAPQRTLQIHRCGTPGARSPGLPTAEDGLSRIGHCRRAEPAECVLRHGGSEKEWRGRLPFPTSPANPGNR